MIAWLPIAQMVLILSIALMSPLTRNPRFMTVSLGVGLIINGLIGGFLLVHVLESGPIILNLGGHASFLGIEFIIDAFSALFTLFVTGVGLFVHLYSLGYLSHSLHANQIAPYYGLLALLYFGVFGLLYTNDLFNTYVFIEILSITTCAIISIARKKRNYMAAFRYLMLNELGSLSFLMGIALLYMITGTLNMSLIHEALPGQYTVYPINVTLALGFIGVGLAMKSAIFPFHEWLPDAHSSAPAPSSALLSGVVVKLYLLVIVKMIFRVFGIGIVDALNAPLVMTTFAVVAMILGSLFALGQKDVKRMLAYSTVSQVGYILLALSLLSVAGLEVMFFYIFSHALIKGTLFLVTGATISHQKKRSVRAYQGLGYVMPLSMTAFSLAAFGMVGIPGTSGFVAKFQIATAFLDQGQNLFVWVLIVSSVLNAIYYFPIVINGFVTANEGIDVHMEKIPMSMRLTLGVFVIGIFILGFAPGLIMPVIEAAAAVMGGGLS